MELWLFLCCCYIFNCGLLVQKYTALLSIFQKIFQQLCSFEQSAVDARRQGDENSNSSVVAETIKLLANSSYGYRKIGCNQHTLTKCPIDEKTHAVINSKLFKKLDHVNISLCEVELAKAQIENKEQRAYYCRVLHSSIRNANVAAVLQLLHQILWCIQIRRFGNGHRLAVSCSCGEGTGRLYQTWNENGIADVAIKWLCR